MFSSNNRSTTHLTCGFKVNTNSPEWHKSMTKILKKIKGGEFAIDVEEGMAYVSGQGDPNKLLKLMGSKKSQATEMAFVKTSYGQPQHYYGQPPPYYGQPSSYYGQHQPYYSQSQAMQPYHHQYSYPGYNNYGYY